MLQQTELRKGRKRRKRKKKMVCVGGEGEGVRLNPSWGSNPIGCRCMSKKACVEGGGDTSGEDS